MVVMVMLATFAAGWPITTCRLKLFVFCFRGWLWVITVWPEITTVGVWNHQIHPQGLSLPQSEHQQQPQIHP